MSCKRFERLIALYVEGDLAERQARNVESHLVGCAACRKFADELKASQVALKDLRHEPIYETDLHELRRRVIDAVTVKKPEYVGARWIDRFRMRKTWVGAVAGALAVAAMAAVYFSTMHGRVPSESSQQRIAATNVVEPAAPPVVSRPVDEPVVRPAAVAAPVVEAAERQPMVIKMLTNNPDVVIILVTNGKEESEHVPKA